MAFLHVGEMTTAGGIIVGTTLRLVPIPGSHDNDADDDIDDSDNKNNVMDFLHLDPLLRRVLDGLSTAVVDTGNCQQANTTEDGVLCLQVLLTQPRGFVTTTAAMGWLERIDVNDDHLSSPGNEGHYVSTKICLSYICSSSPRGQSIYGDTVNDKVRQQKWVEYLAKALVDEVVIEGGVFGIELGRANNDSFYVYDDDFDRECCDQHRQI